jgi:putative membrane protein
MSLANERTLLAYSRTALGLVVAGIAVAGSHTAADLPVWFAAVGVPLIALGASVSIAGRRRFVVVQQAMRRGDDLPAPVAAAFLPFGIAIAAACGLAAAVAELAR